MSLFCVPTTKPINLQIPFLHKSLHKTDCVLRYSYSPFLQKTLMQKPLLSRRRSSLSIVAFNSKSSESSGGEDNQALKTVLKLCSAIKNNNVGELSNIIGDECQCVCNFFSFSQSFQGKKQVLVFFSYLIKYLGKHIEFVVHLPPLHDGMSVGIVWKLDWNNSLPLGKGFSIYTCHAYQGKMLLRNVEMFVEPLLQIEPYKLKMIANLINMLEKINFFWVSRIKGRKAHYLLPALFFMAVSLFILQFALH